MITPIEKAPAENGSRGLDNVKILAHLRLAAGFSTWRPVCRRAGCCGFIGPYPSTTLDKQVVMAKIREWLVRVNVN